MAENTFSIEQIRFSGEQRWADALTKLLGAGTSQTPPDPQRIRRMILASSVRLSPTMAPEAHTAVMSVATRLGVTSPIELYQSAGEPNAVAWLCDNPVVVEVRGAMLALLEKSALHALMGHELGHHVAHTSLAPGAQWGPLLRDLAWGARDEVAFAASRMSMSREVTADRCALVGCGDLDGLLRLMMSTTTGLPTSALTWDTTAYLEQCRELIESTNDLAGTTHPEHSFRAWAASLFARTAEFKALTGSGAGDLALADVNTRILDRLGQAGLAIERLESIELPLELHECGLAGAVLVASADGALAERESAAIERTFAPLVADWQSYLEPSGALIRFNELSPVMASAGVEAHRSLASLLLHVIGADEVVTENELNMFAAIGDAIGAGTMFRAMMPSALRAMGAEVSREAAPTTPPLPARQGEVEAALAAMFRSAARRGGASIPLTRLMRVAGQAELDPAFVGRLRASWTTAGLVCSTPVDALTRMSVLEFTAAAPPAPPVPRVDPSDPAIQRLRRALVTLRDSLVTGDGRSHAVRIHTARPGRVVDLGQLDTISDGLAERVVALVREGTRATLVEAAEAGRHEPAMAMSSQLKALYREDRARREESGAADLFMGSPVLAGVIDGYLVRAPLVLQAASLVTDARGAGSWALVPTADEPPIVNQALLQLIFHRLGYGVDDALIIELDEAAALGTDAVLDRLRARGLEIERSATGLVPFVDRSDVFAKWPARRFEIEDCALLGFFPQSASDILHDYDALIAAIDAGEPPSSLLGAAMELLPADMRTAFGDSGADSAIATTASAALEPVLHLDPSQRNVLVRAREARALVVHGPPGTGKSQVIVNLVADALSRGERVAVVCEKRAAIDVVVQRLDALGLRHLLAPVHDAGEDRKSLYSQLVERLELTEPRRHDGAALSRLQSERDALARTLQQHLDAQHRVIEGAGVSLAELHALASSVAGSVQSGQTPPPSPGAAAGVANLPTSSRDRVAERVAGLAPYFDVISPQSPMRAPTGWPARKSLALVDANGAQELDRALDLLVRSTAAVEEAAQPLGVRPAHASAAQAGLRAFAASRAARQSQGAQRIVVAALLRNDAAVLQPLARLTELWLGGRDEILRTGQRVRFESSEAFEQALPVATKWSISFFRFFIIAWWKARAVIRATLAVQWPEKAAAKVDPVLLGEVRARSRAAAAWKAFDAAWAAMFGSAPSPTDSGTADGFVAELNTLWPHLQTIYGAHQHLRDVGAWPQSEAELAALDAKLDPLIRLGDLELARVGATTPIIDTLGWVGAIDSQRLAVLGRFWRTRSAAVIEADRGIDALAVEWPEARAGVEAIADFAARAGKSDGESLRDYFLAAWAEGWIEKLMRERADIAALDQPTMYGDIATVEARVRALEAQIRQHEVLRIAASRDDLQFLREAPAEPRKRRTATQATREAMLKEARKQRNVMPLRTFVRRFADEGLLDSLPVWLLSPETMVVLFNRAPAFDVVIFDEASQCTMESGFPVMMRGRRVVIAGDDKQMPPTSFFMANVESDMPAPEDDDGSIGLLEAESLLVLARDRAPQTPLLWHYRCLYEELIAFSNYAMYGGELRTVPAVDGRGAAPVRWIAVEDGTYVEGANPNEAKRVIDEVASILARAKPPTVGIVTFNVYQQKAILDEVDSRKARDEAFAALWMAASTRERVDERPFVKNIESVQGDERDVIVFSLGHAPTTRKLKGGGTEKYVAARFGPLNLRGGERRLNVAVSRAKRECVVVASFEPSMLSVSGSRNEGPRLFKAFLEFSFDLANGRRAQAERTLQRIVERSSHHTQVAPRTFASALPVSVQIAEALRARGHDVEVGVGSSGFRIPVAVRAAGAPGAGGRTLAVLTDDMAGANSAFESHVHIPSLLESRGWQPIRVTSRQWHQAPVRVIERLENALVSGETQKKS
jgi:RecA/RadA recombinase